MIEETDDKIKDAVYVALYGASFYCAAKALNLNASVALVVGTAIGKILAIPSNTTYDLNSLI